MCFRVEYDFIITRFDCNTELLHKQPKFLAHATFFLLLLEGKVCFANCLLLRLCTVVAYLSIVLV